MRKNSAIAVPGVLLLSSLYTFALGQVVTPSLDPEREVIVMFKDGAVTPPSGRTMGRPEEFQISSQALLQVLQNTNVEAISRLMPDFRPEDRFAISRNGRQVELTNWTNVYVLRLPSTSAREAIFADLRNRTEVIYAEINGRSIPDFVPNDEYFNKQWALLNDGSEQQGEGTPGADIKVTQAWDITTGSSSIKIGIVDSGMQTNHPDFTGRVSGDAGDNGGHGTVVAGIAAAQGNNGIGIAGVAWNVGIINEDYGNGSDADDAAAVLSAANRGADVINNSWNLAPIGRNSATVRLAFADVYKLDRVAVASMGNQGGEVIQYPAAFGQGIITVGATTNTDVKADYSSTGSWIDVTAPGGGGFATDETADYIFSTVPGSGYDHIRNGSEENEGTSFSAPYATGIAALLLSYNPNLYNDDVEQIIRLSADKVPDMQGQPFTNEYGTGRVNARKALDRLRSPYTITYASASGGTDYSSTGQIQYALFSVPGLGNQTYIVKRHEVRKTVSFPYSFQGTPSVWGRGVATNGYSAENPNYAMGFCDPVAGTITSTGATFRTFVYEVGICKAYGKAGSQRHLPV